MSLDPNRFPAIDAVTIPSAPRPFWSVIVPAYKPQHLEQALRSVLDQDPGPEQMQIVVLDDCSPADLGSIVRRVGGDRIQYIRQPANLGTFATENAGLHVCRGIWTHILNDDDWVLPGFYATFRAALEHQPTSVGAACCAIQISDEHTGQQYSQGVLRFEPGIIEDWLARIGAGNMLHPVGVVVKRSTYEQIGGYLPELKYSADWELYKRSATRFAWWYEPQLLACYRYHPRSATTAGVASGEQIRELGKAIDISHGYFPRDTRDRISAAARETYAKQSIAIATRFLSESNLPAALTVLKEGLTLSSSETVVGELLKLFSHPAAGQLRQLLPEFFKRLEFRPS